MKGLTKLLISVCLGLLISCQTDDAANTTTTLVKAQLTHMYDNGIKNQLDFFIASAEALEDYAVLFANETTNENYEALKNQWKNTISVYKPMEVFTVGDFALTSKISEIHFWPADTETISSNIEQNEVPISSEFTQQFNGRSLGLAALEFIIFGDDLTAFQTGEFAENRLAYIQVLSADLVLRAIEFKTLWLANETIFKTSISNSVTSTQNKVLNAMIQKLDEIANLKLGAPLGLENGIVDVTSTEAFYSQYSSGIINEEIQGIQKIFTGAYLSNTPNNGIYEQLEAFGRVDLVEIMEQKFLAVEMAYNALPNTMEQLILEDNTTTLVDLKDAVTSLEITLRIDIASALNILVTFSDNDGD